MNSIITTDKAPPPYSDYAVAVQTPANSRIVHVSGQVGATLSGEVVEDAERQHELAWENVFAVLNAAGMNKNNIVDVLCIVNHRDQVPIYRAMRDKMLAGHLCASTMLICELAHPDWKVEIAVKAASTD